MKPGHIYPGNRGECMNAAEGKQQQQQQQQKQQQQKEVVEERGVEEAEEDINRVCAQHSIT
ncbi:hypothetical protein P168DRAFT_61515 [Aspergillus campestris IBT 28561]|uniref:Uncharacterized protein n=1 Tax=Aspergillus campestris (strain IBT 28561) TaxID=1392248 RepID=A0A2I1CUG9_ASPC2|nr:uncharacterized protein P168DRAFT_61515 [Aspergillus campestris IBT 28561]PKY01276.1 hypothetical protein P168DRAFT_61515 [Aspergillus campestris IBT 28561]